MQKDIQNRLAIRDAERLNNLFISLERLDHLERQFYAKQLPKFSTVEQVSFLLDIPEKTLREKIKTKHVKAGYRTRGKKLLIGREEVIRISNQKLRNKSEWE
jgi:hypothetical protein